MKTLRTFLLALLVTVGILASAAPIIAATQNPLPPASVHTLDVNPTPTPTPPPGPGPNGVEDCSGGC